MQLSLSTLIIIVSLLARIAVIKSKEENKIMKIPMNNSPTKRFVTKSQKSLFSTRMMNDCPFTRRNRQILEHRSDRMTHVKAILSNPKISPIQRLTEKFARSELKSPKMQETFEKLTSIHSPRQNSREKAADRRKISSSNLSTSGRKKYHDRHRHSRFKGRRKRKRKRHKSNGSENVNPENSSRRRGYNSRGRFARQIVNSSGKNYEKNVPKKRYEKSINHRDDEKLENFRNNDENFHEDPYDNLNNGVNYPGVEDTDVNFQNSIMDENSSLNRASNYSPIGDQSDYDTDFTNSINDNDHDFSLANEQSLPNNGFVSPEENSYEKVRYNENFVDPDSPNNEERENTMRSRQFGFSSENPLSPNHYGILNEKNVKNHFYQPQIQNNRNFQLSNKFHPRNNDFTSRLKNYDGNISPSNDEYRSEFINSHDEPENNHISENEINFDNSAKPTNFSLNDLSTNSSSNNSLKSSIVDNYNVTKKNNLSTNVSGQNLRTIKASRVEKSDQSTEKLFCNNNENCTTTEMNPKLSGIGDASTIPAETSEKNSEFRKNSKSMEYRLLAMNKDFQSQAGVKKFINNRDNNTAVANETKEVAGQILNKIIEELEDIKVDRKKNDRKEGLPCKLSGSWITTQAGVRIDMLVTNRSVNVSMARLDLPVVIPRQGLLNYTWNITGYAPFRRGGPFSLVATDNHTKSLAVFVGACRVCQGVDTIEGIWSMAREPRDCRDFQMATSIYNDIFRRTQLLTAIKEKQLGIISTVKYPSKTAIPPIGEEYSASNTGDAKIP